MSEKPTYKALEKRVQELERAECQRAKAEAALLESETLLRTLNNNLSSGMVYQVIRQKDGTRKFSYLSDAVRHLYGISPQAGMEDASLIYERVHADDRYRIWEEEEVAHKTLSTFRSEIRMIAPSGEIRWSSFVSSPRMMADGSTCWDGIEFDITERKRAEAGLMASENKYKKLVETISDVIFEVNDKGDITYVSPVGLNIWGSDPGEIIGKPFIELIHP